MTKQSEEKVVSQIIDVSLRSALAKEIHILELGTLNQMVSKESAESIREQFTKHNTPIKQITNSREFISWTVNTGLVQNLSIKYVPEDTYNITNELIIFDNTVAVYRLKPEPFYFEVNDASYAETMRNVFSNLWSLGDSLLLTADGSTLTKQYLPLSHAHNNVPVVIYPAKDDGVLEKAFSRKEHGGLENYLDNIIDSDSDFFADADMILAYIWNQENTPCCDVWKVSRNDISDDSGFLYDVRIYKGTTATTDLGVASGNSSIVLTSEEMLLRDLILEQGLSFKEAANRNLYQARFPIGFVPAESFYKL